MKYIHITDKSKILNKLPKIGYATNAEGKRYSFSFKENPDMVDILATGFRPVTEINAAYDPATQVRSVPTVTFDSMVATASYSLEDISDADLWSRERYKRDNLLQQSDWTQLLDAPLTAEQVTAWAVHRQNLRNIPQNFNVKNIIWPTEPS